MHDHHAPNAPDSGRPTLFALNVLITATRALAESLKETARELHDDLGLSVPERSILLELRKNGPMTVPALARHREVSRQFIQATVNPLMGKGILESRPNPAHRRSKLIALTAEGTQLLRQVMRREGSLMQELAVGLAAEDTGQAAADIRQAAETVAQVQSLLAGRKG